MVRRESDTALPDGAEVTGPVCHAGGSDDGPQGRLRPRVRRSCECGAGVHSPKLLQALEVFVRGTCTGHFLGRVLLESMKLLVLQILLIRSCRLKVPGEGPPCGQSHRLHAATAVAELASQSKGVSTATTLTE